MTIVQSVLLFYIVIIQLAIWVDEPRVAMAVIWGACFLLGNEAMQVVARLTS